MNIDIKKLDEMIEQLCQFRKEYYAAEKAKHEKPELRVRIPNGNTPMNTVMVEKGTGHVYFFGGFNKRDDENEITCLISPTDEFGDVVEQKELTIDTIADLKFRMFMNAPKECKWGAIDKDGTGYAHKNIPELFPAQWISDEDVIQVGAFPQYADEWDKILIER